MEFFDHEVIQILRMAVAFFVLKIFTYLNDIEQQNVIKFVLIPNSKTSIFQRILTSSFYLLLFFKGICLVLFTNRSLGFWDCKFRFCPVYITNDLEAWLIYLNKCAKFYQYLGRCVMGLGSGQACVNLPHGSGTMNYSIVNKFLVDCEHSLLDTWEVMEITRPRKIHSYPDPKKLCGHRPGCNTICSLIIQQAMPGFF